jgi:hypothetical protein
MCEGDGDGVAEWAVMVVGGVVRGRAVVVNLDKSTVSNRWRVSASYINNPKLPQYKSNTVNKSIDCVI